MAIVSTFVGRYWIYWAIDYIKFPLVYTVYTKQYVVFLLVDTAYAKQYAVLPLVDTTYTKQYAEYGKNSSTIQSVYQYLYYTGRALEMYDFVYEH